MSEPRKGDVWETSGRFPATATFLDRGDGFGWYSVLIDGPTYQGACGSFVTLASLRDEGFAPVILPGADREQS